LRDSSQQVITIAVVAATWDVVLVFEGLAPLRRTVESKVRRIMRNVTLEKRDDWGDHTSERVAADHRTELVP
jgi:hypothetical protein